MTRVALFIATAGYVGFFPIAPGTAGSLAGLAVFAAIRLVASPLTELVVIAMVLAAGIWAAGITERALGIEDPGPVVIDEVLGMLITLMLLPVSLAGMAAGFVLFRIFDVVKPYPAGRMERLGGGMGIMLDDAMAALYAYASLRVLLWAWPQWFAR